MMRVVKISLLAIVSLVLLLAFAAVILLRSPWGLQLVDHYSRPVVTDLVADQLGSDITYGSLEGQLPGTLVLKDLSLTQDDEVWASFEQLTLRWELLPLLSKRIHVRDVVLDRGRLVRLPTLPPQLPEEPKEAPDEEPSSFDFVVRLDNLVIDDFQLDEGVLGQPYEFSLYGEGRYRDGKVRATLLGDTVGRTDEIAATGDFDGTNVNLDMTVISEPDGVLASLIEAESAIEIGAVATGPIDALAAQLFVGGAQYGEAQGSVQASITDSSELAIDLTYKPGTFLPQEALAALGAEVRLRATGNSEAERANVEITELTGAFGSIAGQIAAQFSDATSIDAALTGNINEAALTPYGAEILAGPLSLTAEAMLAESGQTFSGSLQAGNATLAVTDGQTDANTLFTGNVTASVKGYEVGQPAVDLLLAEGATMAAGITMMAEQRLSVQNLKASLGSTPGRRLRATGNAQVNLKAEQLNTNLGLQIGPAAIALFAPEPSFEDRLDIQLNASGRFDQLKLKADAVIPAGTYSGNAFAAGSLKADVRGLPSGPNGTVTLTTPGDAYRGNIRFAQNGDEISLSELLFRAGQVDLTAQGRFNTTAQNGSITARLDAPSGTVLPTGQQVGGQIDLSAELSERVAIKLAAANLSFDENELGRLEVVAQGPLSGIDFRLDAADLSAGSLFIPTAEAEGALSLAPTTEAVLKTLRINLPGKERFIALDAPVTLRLAEETTLSPLSLTVPDGGKVTASGAFSANRWLAQAEATGLQLSSLTATTDLKIDFDTSASTIANVDFALTTEQRSVAHTLEGGAIWNGEAAELELTLAGPDNAQLGTVQASLPVRLLRGEALGIDVPGDGLDAAVDIEAPFSALMAFVEVDQNLVQGDLVAHVKAQGELASPQTSGSVLLKDASIEDSQFGLALKQMNGGITFSMAQNDVRGDVDLTATGTAGRPNSVRLTGAIIDSAETSSVDLQLKLDKAQLARSGELELRASSDIALTGTLTDLLLKGDLVIDELDLAIPEIEAGETVPQYAPVNITRTDQPPQSANQREADEPQEPTVNVALDLSVRANNGLFVRGRGLISEWGTQLKISGTADAPIIVGNVAIQNGTLDLAGREFDITRGSATFSETGGLDPFLDLSAETEAGDGADAVTAVLTVEGTPDDLNIAFTSTPARPQEDVIALLLFGRPANQLGASEALQLAQAVATLTGTGPFGGGGGMTANLRSGLGLDQLSLDPAARALTVGKYIAEDVYVSARQNLGEVGTVISVVYELSRFVDIEATMRPQGQSLGANYKRDY